MSPAANVSVSSHAWCLESTNAIVSLHESCTCQRCLATALCYIYRHKVASIALALNLGVAISAWQYPRHLPSEAAFWCRHWPGHFGTSCALGRQHGNAAAVLVAWESGAEPARSGRPSCWSRFVDIGSQRASGGTHSIPLSSAAQ